MTTKIGGDLVYGLATAYKGLTGYITESMQVGNNEADMEDVFDEDGAFHARLIYETRAKLSLTLVATTGDFSEFAENAMCTHDSSGASGVDLTDYFVDSAPVDRSKGPARITVNLTNINVPA
ncbi:hypothetical protein N9204_00400 [bacterium]|nr:hypothetical protein [bacterium]